MKGLPIEVTLNKVGDTKLAEPLKRTITIPFPDTPAGWVAHFKADWPTADSIMVKPALETVIEEGLKVLARRATVTKMIEAYKRDAGMNGGRKRAKAELVDLSARK